MLIKADNMPRKRKMMITTIFMRFWSVKPEMVLSLSKTFYKYTS